MQRLPRLAIGPVQLPGSETVASSPRLAWALLDLLTRQGRQVEWFHGRAHFSAEDPVQAITGKPSRYLDSWSMTPESCREIFLWGSVASDLALVSGPFGAPRGDRPAGGSLDEPGGSLDEPGGSLDEPGGSLDELCAWLDLPRLGVFDVRQWAACRLPARPAVDALLLEGLDDPRRWHHWAVDLQSLWGLPVLGALAADPAPHSATRPADDAASVPPGFRCDSQQLGQCLDLSKLLALADSRPFPNTRRFTPTSPGQRLRVATAFDEAFHCYFPTTLEMLEACGAEVIDFSPLHDERLPDDVDLVYLGCGQPERFARKLCENHLMHAALRSHLYRGGRMYAEAAGLAYLCRELVDDLGAAWPMVDVWPLRAQAARQFGPPRAIEATLVGESWIGAAGDRLRGYLNPRWSFSPIDGGLVEPLSADGLLWTSHQAVGSRLHLHFAGQKEIFRRLLDPHPVSTAY